MPRSASVAPEIACGRRRQPTLRRSIPGTRIIRPATVPRVQRVGVSPLCSLYSGIPGFINMLCWANGPSSSIARQLEAIEGTGEAGQERQTLAVGQRGGVGCEQQPLVGQTVEARMADVVAERYPSPMPATRRWRTTAAGCSAR